MGFFYAEKWCMIVTMASSLFNCAVSALPVLVVIGGGMVSQAFFMEEMLLGGVPFF